jgi:hypothetical protein
MSNLRVSSISHRTGTGNIVVPTNNTISGTDVGSVKAPGTLIQVQYATSGFVNQTINSATPVVLSGMSVNITPKFANSKIIVQAMVTASWSYVSSIHVFRNGVDLIANHGGNNQSGGATALWTHYIGASESQRSNQVFPFPVIYQDTPGVTTPLTYDLRANSGWSGGAEAFYFNNRNTLDMLGSSTMMVMEIAQ